MTHRERLVKAYRGEMVDILPYAPRIDLWYQGNAQTDTLPLRHKGRTAYDISRAEGWAIHAGVANFTDQPDPDAMLHCAIGIHALKQQVFRFVFSPRVEIIVKRDGDRTTIEYHTPLGMARTSFVHTEKMKRSGISNPWIDEHIIKRREDYRIVANLFENIDVVPYFDDFINWQKEVGEDGLCATWLSGAASPIHYIQKFFLNSTEFFFHYHDYYTEIQALAETIAPLYEKVLRIIGDSPADLVSWGANFDEVITYAPYFEKEIVPWIRKASATMEAKSKLVSCHCDGENQGLLDLIRDSGMSVAEAVCPYPMTKVRIEDYYRHWRKKLTIFGGIPSNMLLHDTASDEEFEAYMDNLFRGIAPGDRFIVGVADTTPREADFNRLIRIGELIQQKGWLPLQAGSVRPFAERLITEAVKPVVSSPPLDETFGTVQEDVFRGNLAEIEVDIKELIDKGVDPRGILERGLIGAMEIIAPQFKAGELFIPEVLLSSRTMNEGLKVLAPYLSDSDKRVKGKVLLGTVKDDVHDIGKNLVAIMLSGVGFDVIDLGINVSAEQFVNQVAKQMPNILGLSALLTTTMPEMRNVIESLDKAGLRREVKIIVGGAPVNKRFAAEIGADAYGPDAGAAVDLAKQFMGST